jgi:RIMS-binding protein 2
LPLGPREKEEACKELLNTLKYKSSLVEDLEAQLAKVIEKNTELTIQNSDLQKKVVELREVTDECEQLKSTLTEVESECTVAKSEVRNLSGKVRNLECVLEEMHKAAENRREIERQHKEALESLKRKQGEVDIVATKKQAEIIDQMKLKITDLEVERKVLNEKHQELILEMADLKRYGRSDSLPAELENPSDNIEIDQIMAKLEQDNKFLADLEKQRADRSKGDSPPHRASSAITDSGFLSQSSLNGNSMSPVTRERAASLNRSALELPGLSGADKINLLSGSFSASALNNLPGSTMFGSSQEVIVDKDGMVEIPGKGWCWVYLARYSYDPFQHSPNDTPEAELAINAGDYILVWSDPDEDGFFDGEILDGRKGLVPSNFVERLEGEFLVDFYKSVFLGIGDGDDSVCTSIAQDLDFISSDEGQEECQKYFTSRKATLSHYASCTDLDITEDEEEGQEVENVAAPKHLTLETQLNRSFVIGWSPPGGEHSSLDCYQVIVDGDVKDMVKAGDKALKAVVHGYDFGKVHRISVKTLSANSKSSPEAACTMVVGKDAPLGPTNLRATRIRATSASINWMPSNTNFLHTLCLNNVEVRTVKQGVFKHTIAGLAPNTIYKVTVRAKNIKAAPYVMDRNLSKQIDTLSSHLELRTLPQGLPDPPVDVQVEAGPQPNTISVLWLPVTIIDNGLSNGAPVTGYVVYGDGHKLQDVVDSTADNAVVTTDKLSFKTVTVRTKSHDKQSGDSSPAVVPDGLLTPGKYEENEEEGEVEVVEEPVDSKRSVNSSPDSDTELIEKLHTHNIVNGVARSRELIINYSGYPEMDSDIGPSELSDIAEEPEDEETDSEESTSRHSTTPKLTNNNNQSDYNKTAMYKTPVVNALNSWKTAQPEISSQLNTSNLQTKSLSTVQLLSTTNVTNNNTNQKPEQKNANNVSSGNSSVSNNRNERMRIFVALFDYDPPSMSPNPDACDEELPFREGQLIKVFGEKDADGFYWGEAGTRSGFVPCNMVSEVQVCRPSP